MPGPPPPPPMGMGPPPPNMKTFRGKKMNIQDFKKSSDDSVTMEEVPHASVQHSKHHRSLHEPPPVKRAPPPPPPPPPGLGGKPLPAVRFDHLPTPKLFKTPKKTLRLHFAPVNPARIDKDSLWAMPMNINEGAILHSIDKCAAHFEKQADVKVKDGKVMKPAVEQIIGKGGGMEGAAERYIVKSGLSPEQIRQGVLNFEYQDPNILLIIRNLKATLNDVTKVAQLNGAKENYGNMLILDKVGILLAGIPNISTYVQWITRMEDFEMDCKHLLAYSDIPTIAMEKLMSNRGWINTLKLILVIGNSMNAEISPNGAYAIDLRSINKLRDTKSLDGYTFMEFIVDIIDSEFPDYVGFWKDFECLNTGMKVSEKRSSIVEETENLERLVELLCDLLVIDQPEPGNALHKLEKIELMVQAKSNSYFNNHRFVTKIIPVAMRLRSIIGKVKHNLHLGDQAFAKAKIYFSIEPRADGGGEYNVDIFMNDMKLFMNSLEDAHIRKSDREKRARLKSKQAEFVMRPRVRQRDNEHGGSQRRQPHPLMQVIQDGQPKKDRGLDKFEQLRRRLN